MDKETSLLIAKNAATNGRLFCLMIFAVNLAAFANGYGDWYARMAVLCAVPVGLSVLADRMAPGRSRDFLSLVITLSTASTAVLTLLAAW